MKNPSHKRESKLVSSQIVFLFCEGVAEEQHDIPILENETSLIVDSSPISPLFDTFFLKSIRYAYYSVELMG